MADDDLNKLNDGLLKYHELELCPQDLFDDLVVGGWDKKANSAKVAFNAGGREAATT